MPLYEYKCLECGAITEVLRSIKSCNDTMNCARCGAATKRIMSMFNTVGLAISQKKRKTLNTDRSEKAQSTGVRMEGGSATFERCSFQNLQTGISVAKGSKLSMDGNKFKNVDKPVEVTDE